MLARWQRILLLCILLTMAAWLAWQWPHSPWRAVLGALVPLGIYLVVMAVEFALMHTTNRADAAPRASLSQVLGAWWAEVWVALLVFGWRQPFRHQSQPDWLPAQPTSPSASRKGAISGRKLPPRADSANMAASLNQASCWIPTMIHPRLPSTGLPRCQISSKGLAAASSDSRIMPLK